MTPERPHEMPYPGADTERRLGALEGWRGTVEEWRRSVDDWRRMIDREGMVTTLAVMGTKQDQIQRDVAEVKDKVASLDQERQQRRGWTLGGSRLVAVLAGVAAVAAVLVQLVTLAFGGS
jgi:hypothetical protein